MSFEEPNLDHLTRDGEKVYGRKPDEERIRKIVEENKKAAAELAKKLSDKKSSEPVKLYGVDNLDWNQENEPEIEEELKKAA